MEQLGLVTEPKGDADTADYSFNCYATVWARAKCTYGNGKYKDDSSASIQ